MTKRQFHTQQNAGKNIVVVGAGLSGLVAAHQLQTKGFRVTVVDKARGPGGRMSTRREAVSLFDHGAQYFTARSASFCQSVHEWQKQGLVASWNGKLAVIDEHGLREAGQDTERFIGIPGMSAVCRGLSEQIHDIRFNWKAERMQRTELGWQLIPEHGEALLADTLLVSIPPEQARCLLPEQVQVEELETVEMQPCWAVMALLDQPLLGDWDAAFINHGPLSWVSRQSSRLPVRASPGTSPQEHAFVFHASPQWSQQHLEKDADWVCSELLRAAFELHGASAARAVWSKAHRWRYALAKQPLQLGALVLEQERLILMGDWCNGSRVEGAFLSGMAAAEHCLAFR